ncbi:MAG TPA: DUF3006 domain-containing protein [Firmicutes bacterium]|jgi:hypothetical protein|nr:DUF3006 domain-containing protein [Bacillota bacterium]HOQ23769.1 DUF3006 domain-containing protein [Bacillota bacterium]HPT66913.1 DUF3006 domain-containing protein [Bacillota bacterium]
MKVVIDRFESDYAIVELPDRSMEMLPRRLLEPDCREGDVLEIRRLPRETRRRAREIATLAKELWDNP